MAAKEEEAGLVNYYDFQERFRRVDDNHEIALGYSTTRTDLQLYKKCGNENQLGLTFRMAQFSGTGQKYDITQDSMPYSAVAYTINSPQFVLFSFL